jgi:hypothetical protein
MLPIQEILLEVIRQSYVSSQGFNQMSDKSTPSGSNNEVENSEDSIQPVSAEEGLKSAKDVFKAEGDKAEDSGLDEDKEFCIYLKNRKRAKDLGLDDSNSTIIYYQGGVHFANSNIENSGSVVGNDQAIHSNAGTGGFSGEAKDISPHKEGTASIQSVFDRCEDVKQRSFMIALAALNGCNYRVVAEASQRLQTILQPQARVDTEA